MGDKSNIAWTDATWNPVVGCTKLSEGCKHCYAERDHTKRHKAFLDGKLQNIPQYAKPFSKIQLLENRLDQPLKWKKPRKIFVNSLSDLFHPDVPFSFVEEVFSVMRQAKQHTFQILTKRPERMLEFFNSLDELCRLFPLDNVWLGVTVENQEAADHRLPLLLQVPAAVRFVSVEPMLEAVNLHLSNTQEDIIWRRINGLSYNRAFIHLVICGGESGPNARPLHPGNVRLLRDRCVAAGVKFFFKQWGEWTCKYPQGRSLAHVEMISSYGMTFYRTGTKYNGCLLDGREWKELPEVAA